jgi:hypothetical protein
MAFFAGVEHDVIAGGFDMINLLGLEKYDALG